MSNAQYYEDQYNIRARIPEHPEIFARWAENSRKTRARLHCELNVAFGAGEDDKLDVFFARGQCKRVLLFIHGGYWRLFSKSDHSFVAERLVDEGITVLVNDYSLCPKVGIADIVGQCQAAALWAWRNRKRFGANIEQIYVAGHSAGGHLSAMLLATDWSQLAHDVPANFIAGAMPISGLFELEPLTHIAINSDLRLTAQSARELSPALMQPRVQAPLYLSVGAQESEEFLRQTKLLAQRWAQLNPVEIAMPGFHHLNVIEELMNPASALYRGVLRMMRLA